MTTILRRAFVPAFVGLLVLSGLAFAACSAESDEEADARAVLHAMMLLDNAGLHGLDDSVNVDGEIPSSAGGTMVELQTVIGLTPWPSEFEDSATALSETFGRAASLLAGESPNMTEVGAALAAAHDEEHDFSHEVWHWLQEQAGVEAPVAAEPGPVTTVGAISLYRPSVKFTLGDTAAAYVLVRNNGAEDRIVSAKASINGMVQLHETVTQGSTSSMQEVDGGIVVPANGEVELVTGGYHVMLMNVTPELKVGDEVTITLTFEHAGEASFTVKAEQRSAAGESGGHGS